MFLFSGPPWPLHRLQTRRDIPHQSQYPGRTGRQSGQQSRKMFNTGHLLNSWYTILTIPWTRGPTPFARDARILNVMRMMLEASIPVFREYLSTMNPKDSCPRIIPVNPICVCGVWSVVYPLPFDMRGKTYRCNNALLIRTIFFLPHPDEYSIDHANNLGRTTRTLTK